MPSKLGSDFESLKGTGESMSIDKMEIILRVLNTRVKSYRQPCGCSGEDFVKLHHFYKNWPVSAIELFPDAVRWYYDRKYEQFEREYDAKKALGLKEF